MGGCFGIEWPLFLWRGNRSISEVVLGRNKSEILEADGMSSDFQKNTNNKLLNNRIS
jgi:hypothetical protein